MRTDSGKETLLKELLDEPAEFRAGILTGALEVARRRQRRRKVLCAAALAVPAVTIAGILLSLLQPWEAETRVTQVIQSPPARSEKVRQPGSIRVIDDEALFEMLEGRPVAVVGRGENQRIILLDQPGMVERE